MRKKDLATKYEFYFPSFWIQEQSSPKVWFSYIYMQLETKSVPIYHEGTMTLFQKCSCILAIKKKKVRSQGDRQNARLPNLQ